MVAMHLMQAAQRPSICQGQAGWMGRKALKDYAHVQSTSCSARTVSAGTVHHSKKHFVLGQVQPQRSKHMLIIPRAENDDSGENMKYNTEFGYSRKDVILIGGGLIAVGFGIKYGLQIGGVDPLQAGTYAQLAIFLGGLVAWVASYVFRVSTKNMTYVQQLKDYEESVMQKRLDEMTDVEKEKIMKEVDEASK